MLELEACWLIKLSLLHRLTMLTFCRTMLLCTLVSSWHATNIQLFQLMPNTAIDCGVTRRQFTVGEATAYDITAESSSSQHAHVPVSPSLVKINPTEKLRSLLSRKRTERSSPIASPLRSTRSPHTKSARTFAEAAKHHSNVSHNMK